MYSYIPGPTPLSVPSLDPAGEQLKRNVLAAVAALEKTHRMPRLVLVGAFSGMDHYWPIVAPLQGITITFLCYDDVFTFHGQHPALAFADNIVCLPTSANVLTDEACRCLEGVDLVVVLNPADAMPPLLGAALRYARRMDLRLLWLHPHRCAPGLPLRRQGNAVALAARGGCVDATIEVPQLLGGART